MNTAANATKTPTHTATLKGETIQFHFEDFQPAVDALVARHGGGVPKIDTIVNPSVATVVALAPVAKKLAIGEYDAEGDARSQVDRDAAKEAGFSPANPVYRQGSRATGMRQFREAFDKLPLAQSAALALEKTVADEHRKDETVTQIALRMDNQGRLAIGARRMPFGSRRAFGSLVARLGMPAGAATYLPAVEPTTRAMNVNRWTTGPLTAAEDARKEACTALNEKFEPETVVIRTRDNANKDREVYGLVSEGYGDFDADKIAEAIRLAVPPNARAVVSYDGTRTQFDVVFFSNIVPENAVAGEFFQAAARIRTDDTGGGSIVVDAAIRQNLCLNFIILDDNAQHVARIRHVGTPEKLAAKFREAFAAALEKIKHFTEAWGYAVADDVLPRALLIARETGVITDEEMRDYAPQPVSEVLPGLFNGLIERDLVPLPKRDRQATIAQLMKMWELDDSSATRQKNEVITRAAVVNAVTRYAHEVNADPFAESAIEAAGGALLYSKGALPFVPLAAAV